MKQINQKRLKCLTLFVVSNCYPIITSYAKGILIIILYFGALISFSTTKCHAQKFSDLDRETLFKNGHIDIYSIVKKNKQKTIDITIDKIDDTNIDILGRVVTETSKRYPHKRINLEIVANDSFYPQLTYIPDAAFSIGWSWEISDIWKVRLLQSIKLPEGINSIGKSAFLGCVNLENIELPNSVKHIGMCAFADCRSLKNIRIPSFVTVIDTGTFSGCRSLQQIDIPIEVTEIKDAAFENCDSLKYITLNNPNIKLGNHVYNGTFIIDSLFVNKFSLQYPEYRFFNSPLNIQEKAGDISAGEMDDFIIMANLNELMNYYKSPRNTEDSIRKLKEFISTNTNIDLAYISKCRQLATIYTNIGNFELAEHYFEKAIDLIRLLPETNYNLIAEIQIYYSKLFLKKGDYNAQKQCLTTAYKSLEKKGNKMLFAKLYTEYGNYCWYATKHYHYLRAFEYYCKALSIMNYSNRDYCSYYTQRKMYHNYMLDLSTRTMTLCNLILYDTQDDALNTHIVVKHFLSNNKTMIKPVLEQYVNNLQEHFAYMNNNEKEHYYKSHNGLFAKTLSDVTDYHFEKSKRHEKINRIEKAYNTLLIIKGLLLSSEQTLSDIINKSEDSSLICNFKQLKLLQGQQEKQCGTELSEQIDRLESIIVKQAAQYGDILRHTKITWQDVQQAMGKKDIIIEFFYSDGWIYAIILKKKYKHPKMVRVGFPDFLEHIYGDLAIHRNIWLPIEKYLSKSANIYFSPYGELHTLAIEHALINDQKTMSDKYKHLYRISSSRNIVFNTPLNTDKYATIFGDIEYNAEKDTIVKYFVDIDRGNDSKDWEHLNYTYTESMSIDSILRQSGFKNNILTRSAASEDNFKSLSGGTHRIIHIATHGYFRADSTASNDLTNSGLVFAGANQIKPYDNIDDGLLTAQEISLLDLHNTDLVVLSACKTALGTVTGEGVFGIQRGFKKAGVNTIVMSVKKVYDSAAKEFMVEFYKNMVGNGLSKHEAFISAVHKMRNKYPDDPDKWASFIMLDGYR